MKQVTVKTSKTYEVWVGKGLLDSAGERIRALSSAQRVAVVSDDTVAALYAGRLLDSLHRAGFDGCSLFTFPHGEASKTLATAAKLYEFFAGHQITRGDWIIALGGGVVGDVTGFAASTFLRGVRYVQIPTTLLAQVDSSVGGKTAVDLECGKNLVGTFYQPSLVLCDIQLLDTLPREIFCDGAAEVIKYGAIRDRELFEMTASPDYREHLEEIIHRCVSIKRDIVQNDEFDTGERMLLNFGHTLAHAIETQSGYTIPHGRAVATGMVAITKAAAATGIVPQGIAEELERACRMFDLPTSTDFDPSGLAQICLGDKKRNQNQINVILLEQIGRAVIHPMPVEAFQKFICEGCR